MEHNNASLLGRKQFEANEKATRVALLRTMIRDFENVIGQLEGQIAAEEDRTRTEDPAYSTFAKAATKRRQNLLISVAHTRSMLDVAKQEFDQVSAQLRELAA